MTFLAGWLGQQPHDRPRVTVCGSGLRRRAAMPIRWRARAFPDPRLRGDAGESRGRQQPLAHFPRRPRHPRSRAARCSSRAATVASRSSAANVDAKRSGEQQQRRHDAVPLPTSRSLLRRGRSHCRMPVVQTETSGREQSGGHLGHRRLRGDHRRRTQRRDDGPPPDPTGSNELGRRRGCGFGLGWSATQAARGSNGAAGGLPSRVRSFSRPRRRRRRSWIRRRADRAFAPGQRGRQPSTGAHAERCAEGWRFRTRVPSPWAAARGRRFKSTATATSRPAAGVNAGNAGRDQRHRAQWECLDREFGGW